MTWRAPAVAALALAAGLGAPGAARGALPACSHSQLRASLGRGDSGAGHTYWPLVFTNVSGASCTLRGYPGVSSVAGDDGHQVGRAATRDTSRRVTTVTLRPGGAASTTINHVNPYNFPPDRCHVAPTRGFRVYAPGQTRAFYLPQPHPACRIRSTDFVRPVVSGRGG
jgi:Protein of unknown function (DUF4232)